MYFEEKLKEANKMYNEIETLLFTMPSDDSQPIEDEINIWRIHNELKKTQDDFKILSIKLDGLQRNIDTSHREMLGRLPVQRLLVRDRSYISDLAPLMNMIQDDEDHPDIVWIRKWIAHPENSLEEATYFCIHAVKAVAEALAILCHVHKGQWERLCWDHLPLFEALFERCPKNEDGGIEFGNVSKRFDTWIICVVGDTEMCPNSNFCLKMLLLYKLLNIDDENYEEALKAVFSAFCLLNKQFYSVVDVSIKAINDCLSLFDDSIVSRLYQFGSKLGDRLRHHRNTRKQILIQDVSCEYAMGLKIVIEPREVIGLTAYLKYISYRTDIQYEAFQEDPYNERHTKKINESLISLDFIIENFQYTLEQPEMLSVIAECVMNITQNAIRIKYKQIIDGNEEIETLEPLNLILTDGYANSDSNGRPGIIEQEIIRTYKERICRWRSEIPKVFMQEEASRTLYYIIYNDEY